MKQAIVALTSVIAAALGVSQAQATVMATDALAANAPDNLTVRQQKAIHAFAQQRASDTMALIEGWRDAGPAERAGMARGYLDMFFAAADADQSGLSASLLLADALGNASALLAARGHDREALAVTVDEVKAALMRIAYETRHELVAPYIPRQLAWGQHGQHFVRSRNKKKKDRSG
jgi:hypothetical protein